MCLKAALLAVFASLFLVAANANATTLFRTYLSVEGNDGNPCTVSAPCRLLPAALASTQYGGEVWILDSANYNTSTVTISQPVSILSIPGAQGSLVANGATAIDIESVGVITFQNIIFREIDQQTNVGIMLNGGASLMIVGGQLSSFGSPITALSWSRIDIDSALFYNNSQGLNIEGQTAVLQTETMSSISITNSKFIGNAFNALYIENAAATLSHNLFVHNSIGLVVAASANVVLDGNVISGNATGVLIDQAPGQSSTVYSMGNNSIVNNSTDVTGTITPFAQQ